MAQSVVLTYSARDHMEVEHTDHRSQHSCAHNHSQHRTLPGQCLYSSVTVPGIIWKWNILITALTTPALTTILNTGLYQVSVYNPL
jgi:hypothetical protein